MKKKKRNFRKTISKIKNVYLDDIEYILDVLKTKVSKVTLTVDDYELESIEEIKDWKKGKPRNIEFNGSAGTSSSWFYFSLDINENGIALYSSNDDADSLGMFEKIKSHFENRRRLIGVSDGTMKLLIFLAFLFSINAVVDKKYYVFLALITSAILFFLILKMDLFNTKIIFKYKGDDLSFWQRNAEKIFLSAISAILGAVLSHLPDLYNFFSGK